MDVGEASEKGAGAFGAAGGKKVRSYALSHGHSYHHLTYDPSDNNIEVGSSKLFLKSIFAEPTLRSCMGAA